MSAPVPPIAALSEAGGATLQKVARSDFASLLDEGVSATSSKLKAADAAVQAFALDDSVPVHQVTYALEQGRLSFELLLQVRDRLLESYQEFMRMQL